MRRVLFRLHCAGRGADARAAGRKRGAGNTRVAGRIGRPSCRSGRARDSRPTIDAAYDPTARFARGPFSRYSQHAHCRRQHGRDAIKKRLAWPVNDIALHGTAAPARRTWLCVGRAIWQLLSEPRLFLDDVGLVELLVGFHQVHDAFDQADGAHHQATETAREQGGEEHDDACG
jgi:hypothetical protein